MPALREQSWEAEDNHRNVRPKLPLNYLAFTGLGRLSTCRPLCCCLHKKTSTFLTLSRVMQVTCSPRLSSQAGILLYSYCPTALMWGQLQTPTGKPCFGPGAGTGHCSCWLAKLAMLLLTLKDWRGSLRCQGLPFPEAVVSGIHTCVLNSCLWTLAGDLCCGCGNGSGGVCVGLGTGNETSAVHGKLISSVFASYPETAIWEGHRLPQTQETGQHIGPAHPNLSLRHSSVTNTQSISTHPPTASLTTQRADHPQDGHLPPRPHAINKMPMGKSDLLGSLHKKLPPLM